MKNTLYKRYRENQMKYEEGGTFRADFAAGAGFAGTLGAGIIDATVSPDAVTGRTPTGAVIGKGALSGAAAGAQLGPIGAGVGAVLGAGLGLLQASKEKKAAMSALNARNLDEKNANSSRSAAMLATNPELLTGSRRATYFADGGAMKSPLTRMYMEGGYAKPLSSDSTKLIGDSHRQGGIDVPEMQAELEDGETTKGSFVFSKKLGFAQVHEKIAKAKGLIENKPMTAERITTLRRLDNREKKLMMTQEYLKAQM